MPYGTFQYFYPTGEKEAVNSFSDDGIIAESKVYYRNGNLLAEGRYVNRKKDGIWIYYSEPDSKIIAKEEFKKGKLDSFSESYYAETGNLLERFAYTNGQKNGPYEKFFPDGSPMIKGNYKMGKLDGNFVSYYGNGQVQVRGVYREGKQIENWEYFDDGGQMVTKEVFKGLQQEEQIPE